MWLHLALIFLAGTALVDSTVWKPNQTYRYMVRTRALTGAKVSDQVSGIVMKGYLNVHVRSPDVLIVELTKGEYSSIHASLPDGWNVPIPDYLLRYVSIPSTGDPLKVTFRNGKVDEVFATLRDANNPYTVNIIKGLLSQLQFETDKLTEKQLKKPLGHEYAHQIYTGKEQTVTGYCKTEYDLRPISREDIKKTNLLQFETPNQDGYLMLSKYKNYKDCMQETSYQFTVTDNAEKHIKENYITRLSTTNMIVSHKKEYFTILSSIMENVIQVKPKLEDMESSKMFNMMNLTLVKVEETTSKADMPKEVVSTGNLTYVYNIRERGTVDTSFHHDLENLINIRGISREHAEFNVHSTSGRGRGRYSEYSKQTKHSSEENSSESSSREHFTRNHENERATSRGRPLRDYTISDILKEIDSMIHDIAMEIMTPDEIVRQGTLEKYTILTRMLRYMNETSLTTVRDKLEIDYRAAKLDVGKIVASSVFRNALAQTGTFAAFKLIRTMITTKMFTNLEAAFVLGQLPRAVRSPTQDYIQQFYELIKSPEVRNQAVLNTTAPYAFSELVRYALVMDQKYIYPYPETHSKTHKEEMLSTYISYFADELEEAYKAKRDSLIVTYIMALGNIGHPAVVRVFEPYLEGKYRLTTFQRTIMVSALGKVYPGTYKVIGPIMYKIYQNQKEHYQVRVMALNVLFKNNPPEHIMMNIAKTVSDERDVQVKNAVLTGIESLTRLKGDKYARLVRSALAANRIITQHDQEYNIRYSSNIILDYVNKKRDYDASLEFSTIGSKTKTIPKFVDLTLTANSSFYSPPAFRTQYGVSDINLILRTIRRIMGQVTNEERSTVDELAEKLNIVYNEVDPEGSFVISNEYGVFFVVFDRYTLQSLEENFKKLIQTTKNGYNKEYIMTRLLNKQFIISYPSEIGLPVNYRLTAPILVSLRNKLQTKEKDAFEISQEMNMVVNRKTISRITFLTPFSDEQYFTGVDVDWQLRVPVAWSAKIDLKQKHIGVEIKTIPGTEKAKLWQHYILPYTGKTRFPNFKGARIDKNTQPIIVGKINKSTMDLLGRITFKHETDSFVFDMFNQFNVLSPIDAFENILNFFVSIPLHYHKQEISMNPGRSNSIIVKVNYANLVLRDFEQKLTENLEKEHEELWAQSETKVQDVLTSDFLKVHLLIPGGNIDYTCFGNAAQLLVSKNLAVRCYLVNSSKVTNVCGSATVHQKPSSCLAGDQLLNKIRPFKILVRYGESCRNGKEISIKGLQKQNENVKEEIMHSKTYERSKEELGEGTFGLVNTDKVCKLASFMDELMLSVKMDPEDIKTLHFYTIKWLLHKVIPHARIYSVKSEDSSFKFSNFIESTITRQLQNRKMNVTLNSGSLAAHLPADPSLMSLGKFINHELDTLWGMQHKKRFCTLGNTRVKTFDNKVYPIGTSKCSRMMMISPKILKRNSNLDNVNESPDILSCHKIAISLEDLGEKENEFVKRQITITYKNKKLQMRTSDDAFYVNGKPLKFIENEFIEKDLNIRFVKLTSVLYKIIISPAEVVMWFNGENVKIQASDAYNGHIRGLCGTKDDNEENDFTTPQGCVVKKPEDFVAFYTFDNDSCFVDEKTKKLRERALEKCRVIEYLQTNVVADASSEEGRSSQESTEGTKGCTLLRTDIQQDDKQACFSMRPIPVCSEGCKKWFVTKKPITYHCEVLSPEIHEMIERIKAGANPDFSTKTPSMVKYISLPKMCRQE
ncbi:vitellogenin-like [Odontomachus brunneus]|uniref:vitellogenin-like n=1 Tax=Odontomachus brunneus TaxID=486640 RepID=UPI0013F2A431|nr:vitellogenin-like [Odontomachus brunneus]